MTLCIVAHRLLSPYTSIRDTSHVNSDASNALRVSDWVSHCGFHEPKLIVQFTADLALSPWSGQSTMSNPIAI